MHCAFFDAESNRRQKTKNKQNETKTSTSTIKIHNNKSSLSTARFSLSFFRRRFHSPLSLSTRRPRHGANSQPRAQYRPALLRLRLLVQRRRHRHCRRGGRAHLGNFTRRANVASQPASRGSLPLLLAGLFVIDFCRATLFLYVYGVLVAGKLKLISFFLFFLLSLFPHSDIRRLYMNNHPSIHNHPLMLPTRPPPHQRPTILQPRACAGRSRSSRRTYSPKPNGRPSRTPRRYRRCPSARSNRTATSRR